MTVVLYRHEHTLGISKISTTTLWKVEQRQGKCLFVVQRITTNHVGSIRKLSPFSQYYPVEDGSHYYLKTALNRSRRLIE